ncbi:MAG: DUF4595 domain-containing protein [Bacillus cereus]|nr:DUF4595 domain-containing protein [Bacillus cereus]
MSILKKITWSILCASCFAVFTACSNDDDNVDNPNPTSKQPKSISDMTMSYKDGVLDKIETTDGKRITFNYSLKTKSTNNNVQYTKMTIEDEDGAKMYFELKLNENGFIKSCIETYENTGDEEQDNAIDTLEFDYNANGQLIYMKRSEGGNEVTNIKYEDGNIVAVSMKSEEDEEGLNTKVFYTSNDISTAIENKNNIMLFDITFGIDMDEMKYAYWAGLLGKATKHLPIKIAYIENSEDEDIETFEWTITDNYVQKMIQRTSWGTEEYLFTW